MLRAAGDARYDLRYFNHGAGGVRGTVRAVSQAKVGRLTWVAEWHPGEANVPRADALAAAYKARTGKDLLAPRIEFTPLMLAAAIDKAAELRGALRQTGDDAPGTKAHKSRDDYRAHLEEKYL